MQRRRRVRDVFHGGIHTPTLILSIALVDHLHIRRGSGMLCPFLADASSHAVVGPEVESATIGGLSPFGRKTAERPSNHTDRARPSMEVHVLPRLRRAATSPGLRGGSAVILGHFGA
jgi:hypothetical protein